MEIQAYFEEWSRRPGDTVRLAISTPHASIRASLVRLISGPGQGDNIEGRVTDFSSVLDATVPGRIKATMVGSYAQLSLPAEIAGRLASVHCWVWPTVPERATPQAVWSLGDIALVTASGRLELRSKTDVLASIPNAMIGKHWYSIVVTIGDGELSIDLKRLDGKVNSHRSFRTTTATTISSETLILAASGVGPSGSPLLSFNGKIDSPTLYLEKPTADPIAAWHAGDAPQATAWAAWKLGEDFAAETISPTLKDVPPGRLVNGVERGVTGRNWDGRRDSFTEAPQQYCALQFHDDDMVDAGWSYDIEFALPDTLRSGVYAVRLEAAGNHTHFPLFVGPKTGMTAPVLFLIPTNTYLAYGNDHLASLDFSSVMPHDKVVPADEQYLFSHPEPGRSCYDTHADGTPVRYSSRRRRCSTCVPAFPIG
jgi:N,N-dimethylformamidase